MTQKFREGGVREGRCADYTPIARQICAELPVLKPDISFRASEAKGNRIVAHLSQFPPRTMTGRGHTGGGERTMGEDVP